MRGKESHRRLTRIPSQGTPVANAKETRLVNKPRVRGLRACERCVDHRIPGVPSDEIDIAGETMASFVSRYFFLSHPVYLGNFPRLPLSSRLPGLLSIARGRRSLCEERDKGRRYAMAPVVLLFPSLSSSSCARDYYTALYYLWKLRFKRSSLGNTENCVYSKGR